MPNSILMQTLMDLRTTKMSRLLTGVITKVNPKTHLYEAACSDGSTHPDIPLASNYVNSKNGNGSTSVADIGTQVLVAITENQFALIIGCFVPVGIKRSSTQTETGVSAADRATIEQKRANSYEGRSGNRTEDLNIDDQELKGPGGNYVRVRANKTIEIVSEDGALLTRWIACPGENCIMTLATVIEIMLPTSKIIWKNDVQNQSTYFSFDLKSETSKPEPDIFIKAGKLPDNDPDAGNTFVVTIKGESELKITYDGNELKIKTKDLNIEATGKVNVKSKTATIEAKSKVTIKGGEIELN